jgi:flagella basal body P-ring formation protein FlgA
MTQTALAAVLRPAGTLVASTVKLSDLFDELSADIDRVIGPGPVPGGRIIVEAAQLAAIARQFGVDWHPASPADRLVLERPGRPLGRDDILQPLRAALAGAGAPPDAEVDLHGFAPPMVAADGRVDIGIEQLDYVGSNGRFAAIVAISGFGVTQQKIRVVGAVIEMVEIPILTRRLSAGSVMTGFVAVPL